MKAELLRLDLFFLLGSESVSLSTEKCLQRTKGGDKIFPIFLDPPQHSSQLTNRQSQISPKKIVLF